ncbi:L-aspartate oxidase [Clostridia bacterium]|nr:L-aspartate oxidase [Clostridia bacterium]
MYFLKYDVIIAGAGAAGLYTALNLSAELKVLVLSKDDPSLCNSALAQGGIAAVLDKESDSFLLHMEDTLTAGGHENNPDALRILVEEGPEQILRLRDNFGVNFDKADSGKLSLTLEGGHSRNRIVHCKDTTGFQMLETLFSRVTERENITVLPNSALVDIYKDGENFFLTVCDSTGESYLYYTTKHTVIATGGIGKLYKYTTNSKIATGDGIYFAEKLGAVVRNLSYIQFHPTAFDENFSENNPYGHQCFLLSEAMRGEGALLLNCRKERFMPEYEPERLELAPRDVVSRCIMSEQKKTGSWEFYLDISGRDSEFVKNRFPGIYKNLLKRGIDITKEPAPIYPCQHYLMGGIAVDADGRTSVPGLFAAGECSCTGVHGNNRLASNSLLEALVFPKRIADVISAVPAGYDENIPVPESFLNDKSAPSADLDLIGTIRSEVQKIMQTSYFVTPDIAECRKNLPQLESYFEIIGKKNYRLTPELIEVTAMTKIAINVLTEIIKR